MKVIDPTNPTTVETFQRRAEGLGHMATSIVEWATVMPLVTPEQVSAELAARVYVLVLDLLAAAAEEDADGVLEGVYAPLLMRLETLTGELEAVAKYRKTESEALKRRLREEAVRAGLDLGERAASRMPKRRRDDDPLR